MNGKTNFSVRSKLRVAFFSSPFSSYSLRIFIWSLFRHYFLMVTNDVHLSLICVLPCNLKSIREDWYVYLCVYRFPIAIVINLFLLRIQFRCFSISLFVRLCPCFVHLSFFFAHTFCYWNLTIPYLFVLIFWMKAQQSIKTLNWSIISYMYSKQSMFNQHTNSEKKII